MTASGELDGRMLDCVLALVKKASEGLTDLDKSLFILGATPDLHVVESAAMCRASIGLGGVTKLDKKVPNT